jgi:WD40 repeat protein
VREIQVDRAPVRSVSLDEDGRLLAVGDDAGRARVWDTGTGRPVTPPLPAAHQRVSGVALNGPGTLLATAGDDAVDQGRVSLWRLGAGQPRPQILHTGVNKGTSPQVAYATAVAFSRDGRLLLVGNNNNYLDVFRVDGPELLRSFDTLRGVRGLAISPDGTQIADGGTNGPVLIYSLRTGRQVWAFQGHHGRVTGLAFSPDGRMLASTSPDDHTLRLWDLETGVPFGNPIPTGISAPASLGWTPDGQHLVAPTATGAAVFNMNESSWQPAACAVAGRNMTRAEWERYLPGRTYRATCPDFPLAGS